MLRKNLVVVVVALLCCPCIAQVAPPKHESRWHHLFSKHRERDNLEQRYSDLKCALVVVDSGIGQGTGFFISADGDVVTAFHVLGVPEFVPNGAQMTVTLHSQSTIRIKTTTEFSIPISNLETNATMWTADLAVLKTGHQAPCWVRLGDDTSVKVGQHVIAFGFPGLGFGSLSMYSGIIVARLKNDLPIAMSTQGPLKHDNEFLRVQMPISTGISGGPLINDENEVVGIVTEAGAWGSDLELLTQKWKNMSRGIPQPDISTDLAETAHLAEIVHDYASPGYGDAVPVGYLKRKAQESDQQSSPPAH
jgi:S1-C subfamily serine protease